jgi:hypothetical protein
VNDEPRLRAWLLALRDDAADWCENKSPWARGPLTSYFVYASVRHLIDPLYRSWFAGITLVFHELGHFVFIPFGRTMTILGGSLLQLIVPTFAAAYLLFRQRDWFGLAAGVFWLSFSTVDLATYVDDANKEALALVSMGGIPEHDWSTLLTEWHCLNSAQTFAGALRAIATLEAAAAASTLAVWLVRRIAQAARKGPGCP